MAICSKNYCCRDCGNLISWMSAMKGNGRCKICANIGDKNPQFIDGRSTIKNKCIDCGKEIIWVSKRCKRCSRLKEKNYNFKDIKSKFICKICGNPISAGSFYGKGKCIKCYRDILKLGGKNTPNYINRIQIPCFECGKIIKRRPKLIKEHNFCTQKCRGKWHSRTFIGKNNSNYGKVSHGNSGKYNGIFMRSSWELNFAKWCDLSEIKYKYEPKAFELENTSYRPDFYLPEFDCYIEIKGYWRDDAKEKVEDFIKIYPNLNFKILYKKDLQELGIIK